MGTDGVEALAFRGHLTHTQPDTEPPGASEGRECLEAVVSLECTENKKIYVFDVGPSPHKVAADEVPPLSVLCSG